MSRADWQDSIRRADLAQSYHDTSLDDLLRDIHLLQQIAMFKLHMERLGKKT